MTTEHILLTMDDQGDYQGIVCASRNRAYVIRKIMEDGGIETYGIIRKVSPSYALLGGNE